MKIIDGKKIAQGVRNELKQKILKCGIPSNLSVILMGDNPASEIYVKNKVKAAKEVGINTDIIRISNDESQSYILNEIKKLNDNSLVNGILIQLPLPPQINCNSVIEAIDPKKDVDGFHPINIGKLMIGEKSLIPCTPSGIMRLLSNLKVNIKGKHAVVVGRSNIVGKPISILLQQSDATVTLCHSHTRNLSKITKEADILIVAIGKPNFLDQSYVKKDAIVIDVGINRVDDKLTGDVNFESVFPVASAITPVPGGVGPMTIAMLLNNTFEATKLQIK